MNVANPDPHLKSPPGSGRAGRTFLQALRVTRAQVLSFSRAFSKLFFRIPRFEFPRSKFGFEFLFCALQLKNISRSLNIIAFPSPNTHQTVLETSAAQSSIGGE